MRAVNILRGLRGRCSGVHSTRLRAIFVVADAVARVGRLSVAALGRGLLSSARPKHSIKRVDRLLSNRRLDDDRLVIYAAMARRLLAGEVRPLIILDWTQLVGGFHGLVAAVPGWGRAIPILVDVFPEALLNSPVAEAAFLSRLRRVLPARCRPIIVTDAGFRRPFFERVRRFGWDFVGRVRGKTWLDAEAGGSSRPWDLFASATREPRDLGRYAYAPQSKNGKRAWPAPLLVRVVTVLRRAARRRHACGPTTSRAQRKAIQGAREPWVLVTSLDDEARRVVDIYGTRMSIEQTFRDTKNHRWGYCLRDVRCRDRHRLANLLLLASLAFMAVILVGRAAENANVHRGYQANTSRRRCLSLFLLGSMLWRQRPFDGATS